MIKLRYFISLLVLVFLAAESQAQCAMCKENAKGSGMDINSGIIFLIIVPYVLLFILFRKKIFAFFREFKRIH
ncbi:MAG: hypothetical protein HOL28_02350 [Crocinitomicaceae bacterium]|nr:hypothetical protein [Crocinitomicaceae bacterium]MBT6513128.1 hypothetical protein [Crocinitomicaceae bacterium]MDG2331602.1 hypothetical protein [Flavobacteriales bacterium]